MLDSNQTLNIIINPGKLLPAQKFSKEWTIFYLYSYKAQNKRWLTGWQAGRQKKPPPRIWNFWNSLKPSAHCTILHKCWFLSMHAIACQVIAHSHDASCWDNPPFQLSILTNWSSFSSSADLVRLLFILLTLITPEEKRASICCCCCCCCHMGEWPGSSGDQCNRFVAHKKLAKMLLPIITSHHNQTSYLHSKCDMVGVRNQ